MSTNNTQETEELIIKLLKKLERKGKHIQTFLWRLMGQFEDEQFDEKNDESEFNNKNNNKITLLYNSGYLNVCKVGHGIRADRHKHLSIEPCIICGHRNTNNKENKPPPNNDQILQFLNNYNTKQIPFGPHENQKREIKLWVTKGRDKQWPLHYAAIAGDIAQINQLSTNKNIEVDQKRIDMNDITPISSAACYGQLESVIALIKHGAHPLQPPDKGNYTPFAKAVYWKHKSIVLFFKQYIKYLYNFEINKKINLECYKCYIYDVHFNKHILNGTMTKYVYCANCTLENVKKVKMIQNNNKMIEQRIIKTIKENPSISVDTLCQMKDVKALHTILKEVMVSGAAYAYWLWLLDIDNFKAINTHLTHAIADTKIQALGEVLKQMEVFTFQQWRLNGYDGINKVIVFRQGGDEFALVINCNYQKRKVLQKLYQRLRNDISQIKLENMTMKHITVSIGVCHGQAIDNYEEMMKKADEAAESVKKSGKDDIAIYFPDRKTFYKTFNDI